jgi:3-phenylpropionate/trans-cinnamate dioxygenase ferredoxin reductase subunit
MGDGMQVLSINTGIVAFSLLVVVFVLIARLPSLLSTFGIERILRMHRVAAIFVVAVVVFHVGLVLVSDPRGLSIFDLAHTTWAARAAVLSTVALAGTVVLAIRRRRRQPRYEGWRMLHIALAALVFAAALLHVVALHHLAGREAFAIWFALMAVAVLAVAARRWLWLPLRAKHQSYIVEKVTSVAGNAVNVEVRATMHRGVAFHPGQFAWLKIGSSCFVFEEHPFTIASTAEAPYRKQFTVKALGDFSELLRGMQPGRRVFLDGPYGEMTTDGLEKSLGFMFIAAGIGVTPMLSMLRTLADRRDRRAHLLLLGATTMDDVVLRDEIDELRERLSLKVVYTLQQPPATWPGEQGRIDGDMLDRWIPGYALTRFDYFVCGPPKLVSTVGVELRNRGVPTKRIHTERFEVV